MLIGFHHSTWLSSSTTFYSIGSKCFFFFKDYFHESRAKLKWIKVGLNPLKPFIQLKWPFKRFGSFWKTKVTGREKDFVEEIEDYLHDNLFEIFSWKWNACRRFWCTIETRSGAIESVWKGPNKSCELSSIWFSISFKFGSIFFFAAPKFKQWEMLFNIHSWPALYTATKFIFSFGWFCAFQRFFICWWVGGHFGSLLIGTTFPSFTTSNWLINAGCRWHLRRTAV